MFCICYNKVCWIGFSGENEIERAGEECKNALTWQSTIKWGNVWSFITNTPHPPFLPCYPVLLGEIWEEERGQGGLRRPEHSFNSALLFSPLQTRYRRTRSTRGHRWLTVDLSFSSPPSSCRSWPSSLPCPSAQVLLFPSFSFLSCKHGSFYLLQRHTDATAEVVLAIGVHF